QMNHYTILIDNNSSKKEFIQSLLKGNCPEVLENFKDKNGLLFSSLTINKIIEEEDKRDHTILSTEFQRLETMSSGEQKKALLYHLLDAKPDYIILDNPFDNLDVGFVEELKSILKEHSSTITFIQFVSRKGDILSFIENFGKLDGDQLIEISSIAQTDISDSSYFKNGTIPPPPEKTPSLENPLLQFKNVSTSYGEKNILRQINWTVQKSDFWQLIGPNGSGKTTILSMIIGDNPKAFGQDIFLFGKRKGSGESVWEIKKNIGYYSPALNNKFNGRHSVEHMLISGLTDSVGLYTLPTEVQKRVIKEWLQLLGLEKLKNTYFNKLSVGQQRLVMTARAMVKHPPLLILDEPTAGMDDSSAGLLVSLVNKIATDTHTAIIFVSHRKESGLEPKNIFRLQKTATGSIGSETVA
ncbi:MAG: ATP-binding cassette domain-containing protein, partial [Maribacter sp.]